MVSWLQLPWEMAGISVTCRGLHQTGVSEVVLPLPCGQGENRGPRGCAPAPRCNQLEHWHQFPPGKLEGQDRHCCVWPRTLALPQLLGEAWTWLWSLCSDMGPTTPKALTPTLSLLASPFSSGECLYFLWGIQQREALWRASSLFQAAEAGTEEWE